MLSLMCSELDATRRSWVVLKFEDLIENSATDRRR
jgi:hypothetical protein